MSHAAAEYARFFRADDLAPLECLDARYVEHVFAPHFHEEYVVNTLIQGSQRYHYHGSSHQAGRGQLIVINPGEVHTGEAGEESGWAYRGFYPSAAFMRRLAQEISGRADAVPYFRATVLHDAELAERLNQLHLLLCSSEDRLQRESALYAVFSAVLRRHMSVDPQPLAAHPRAVERVRALLADRLADNLSLQQLADAVELSPYHLNRLFRQHLGLPPVAWRNQLRVARARTLLARGGRPADIALELGFADQAHLTRAFRHALGVTPAAYQRAVGARSFKTADGA